MNLRCLAGHEWGGCRCLRCGKSRDEAHDWIVSECRTVCRRCGLVKGMSHDWQGCVCRRCRAENHQWAEGVCSQCGERCSHADQTTIWDTQVFHPENRPDQLCSRCGAKIPKS